MVVVCGNVGGDDESVSSMRSQGLSFPAVIAWSEGCESLKNWGGGKKTHSVLEGSPSRPMCTSSPKCARWLWMRISPLIHASWVGKGKALSLT